VYAESGVTRIICYEKPIPVVFDRNVDPAQRSLLQSELLRVETGDICEHGKTYCCRKIQQYIFPPPVEQAVPAGQRNNEMEQGGEESTPSDGCKSSPEQAC